MSIYSKKLTVMKEPLEIDLQLAAAEMDTSVPRMKYVSNTIMEDALTTESFQKLWNDIKVNAPEITSIDGNTTLVEYFDDAVILHENLESKYIIFDKSITQRVEEAINRYKAI